MKIYIEQYIKIYRTWKLLVSFIKVSIMKVAFKYRNKGK